MLFENFNRFSVLAFSLVTVQLFVTPARALRCVQCKDGTSDQKCYGSFCQEGNYCFTRSEPNAAGGTTWSKGCVKIEKPPDTECTTTQAQSGNTKSSIKQCFCNWKDLCNNFYATTTTTTAPTTQPATTVENTAQCYKQGLIEMIVGLGVVIIGGIIR